MVRKLITCAREKDNNGTPAAKFTHGRHASCGSTHRSSFVQDSKLANHLGDGWWSFQSLIAQRAVRIAVQRERAWTRFRALHPPLCDGWYGRRGCEITSRGWQLYWG